MQKECSLSKIIMHGPHFAISSSSVLLLERFQELVWNFRLDFISQKVLLTNRKCYATQVLGLLQVVIHQENCFETFNPE